MEESSTKQNEVFSHVPIGVRARRDELDRYLTAHANRSMPIQAGSNEIQRRQLHDMFNKIGRLSSFATIQRTKIQFASGELMHKDGELTLRATNWINGKDTVYRLSARDENIAERITVPPAMVEVQLDNLDVNALSQRDDLLGNPVVVLSVSRAALLFCEFVSGE